MFSYRGLSKHDLFIMGANGIMLRTSHSVGKGIVSISSASEQFEVSPPKTSDGWATPGRSSNDSFVLPKHVSPPSWFSRVVLSGIGAAIFNALKANARGRVCMRFFFSLLSYHATTPTARPWAHTSLNSTRIRHFPAVSSG